MAGRSILGAWLRALLPDRACGLLRSAGEPFDVATLLVARAWRSPSVALVVPPPVVSGGPLPVPC